MKRWQQHPPSRRRVLLVLGVLALCLAVYGLESAGLWPDWMTGEQVGGRSAVPRL